MYLESGRLVLSPTDLVGYLHCGHLTQLSLEVATGARIEPEKDDPELAVMRDRGLEHEYAYLDHLRSLDRTIVDIATEGELDDRATATVDALRSGPDVIYQATFVDRPGSGPIWRGHADFLRRVEVPSELGPFSYEPEDTKLARQVRPSAVIQLCAYAEGLGRVQGRPPEQVHVVLGGEEVVTLRLADFAAYHRAAKARFEQATADGIASYPFPVQHCAVCSWRTDCDTRRLADDHLTVVAGLTVEQARKLEAAGITTVSELAGRDAVHVHGIGSATASKLGQQARLQVQASKEPDAPPPYELLQNQQPGIGLGALPPPSPGDLFFDIEGDPYADGTGLEYLLGVGWIEDDGAFGFRAFWAHSRPEEKVAFESFIDFVTERRAADPALHIYHFAPYEPTALGRLMGRHGTREEEVDDLLRAGVLVDLLRVVRQCLRVGTPSYSLKRLEALYMEARTQAITDAGSSIVEYERWLQRPDDRILNQLEEYNRVDCESTQRLRDWLEQRRVDYGADFGAEPARPAAGPVVTPEAVAAERAETAPVRQALATAGERADATEQLAYRVLGDLLEWHRRESKPEWWQFHHRIDDCDEDDLFADSEAVSGLEFIGLGETVKQSVVRRYRFDPSQEQKLPLNKATTDPAAERIKKAGGKASSPGTLWSIDPVAGTLELLRSRDSKADHPSALIPGPPIRTDELRGALRRLALSAATDGIDGPGPYRAARDLLLARPPRMVTGRGTGGLVDARLVDTGLVEPGESSSAAAIRIAGALDHGCLAVQGPPGSGKTRTAASMVVALVKAGKTVGITANSHAVITNLLRTTVEEAERQGVSLRAVQKAEDDQGLRHPSVSVRKQNADVLADVANGVDLVAGTAWLFSRQDFDQALDYLIVDEAGQMSLANALAVGTSATNLVLVGDPRQLSQPSKGTHPDGAGVSALDHMLAGADTMPEDLGIFLDHTHRLHPDICEFVSEIVYDGRLHSVAGCERQAIGGEGSLAGSGLRWAPVDHTGNRSSSPEEALVVHDLYEGLLGRTFTDRDNVEHELGPEDILVVAPYNAQVSLLGQTLPDRARVGTVDKFQGQEAPIVIVSLATSSLDAIPRGMEFLFSRNRLNVAVSRSKALTVIVGSPALLAVKCNTVEQLRLANGLCRYVELAELVG